MTGFAKQLRRVIDLCASYGLACILLLFLLLLTYLGTVEQTNLGLYETQQKYFGSFFLVHYYADVMPVPLPGVYLLLGLLSINLFCGGIVRVRKGWTQIGILIAHAGILVLFIGGFITVQFSINGHMTLFENQRSDVFRSYHEWEIAIAGPQDHPTVTEYVIPGDRFSNLGTYQSATFRADAVPFAITLRGYARNVIPQQKGPMFSGDADVVDGFYLMPLQPRKENEQNIAGLYTTLQENNSGKVHEIILWGAQRFPASVTMDGENWTIDLRRRRWKLPFTVVLDKFTRELHPRTNMPRVFSSDITKIENGVGQKIKISMNEPLRHKGYTLFQASWGPTDAGPNDPLFSTFAVVKNPADKFPLYACIIITLGLSIHFSLRLARHLRMESGRRS